MDPVEFFQFGLKIIGGSKAPGSAACLSAISRAYYAALYRADQTLAVLGVSCGKGPQKHGLAVRFLHATDDPDLKKGSRTLDDLRTQRTKADYDMSDVSVEKVSQAKKALGFAKDIIDCLEAVENEATRRTSAESYIKSHQRKTHTP